MLLSNSAAPVHPHDERSGPKENGPSSFHHLTGAGCTNLLTRQGGSSASVNIIGMSVRCTNTLNNAGATTSGNIIADVVF